MSWVEEQYYFNEEWNIMSREQLIRKGSCCGLGCTACPYSKPRKEGNTELENEDN